MLDRSSMHPYIGVYEQAPIGKARANPEPFGRRQQPSRHFALADFEQAIPDRKVLGVAFVGSDGVVRVWLNNDVESFEQHDWIKDKFQDAGDLARGMFKGAA